MPREHGKKGGSSGKKRDDDLPVSRSTPASASSSSTTTKLKSSTSLAKAVPQSVPAIIKTTESIRYRTGPRPQLEVWGKSKPTVEGTQRPVDWGALRLDCSTSIEAAKLQLLASLSTCMLHFLVGGAEALCMPRSGASASSSSTESKRESNAGEVQFGYDNRGLYGASNERGISVVVLKALFKAVAESDFNSEDEESPLPRAIARIKQILDFVPDKKPLNPKIQTFKMAAEDSTWANNVERHLSGADERVRVELTQFLFAIRSGHGLETALNYENDTSWPGGTAVLHAELRILNAAWIAGSGDLLLTGAKRACWGCHCVLEDVHTEALFQRRLASMGGTSGQPLVATSSSSVALPSSSAVTPPTMTRSRSISPTVGSSPTLPQTSMRPESPTRPSSPTMASSSMLSSAPAMMDSTLPTSSAQAGSTLLPTNIPEYFRIMRLADEDLSGWAFSDTYCGLHGSGRSETTVDPATLGSTLTRRRSLVRRY